MPETEARVRLVPCPRCGKAMRSALVKTAIWVEERLFVVEDIPAQVCDSCLEQWYDDDVTDALRRLAEDEFPAAEVKREILVPVFTIDGRLPVRRVASAEDEIYIEY